MKSLILLSILCGVAVLPGARPISCQTTEPELAARLQGKPLYLRGMWAEDKLVFDATGTPQGRSPVLPFTEAAVDVHFVKLKGNHLEIEGQRVALAFDDKGNMSRVPFKKIRIDIAGAPGADYGKALDSVFASNLASLNLPSYWQRYAQRYFSETGVATPSAKDLQASPDERAKEYSGDLAGNALHLGGDVQPPKVISMVNPSFTPLARKQKFSGTVQIYLWVQEDGSISHLSLIRPVGMGLDENAVTSVQKYKFAPAMKDGKPVKVDLYIDVNFQIFD